jgi:hypothetical protein
MASFLVSLICLQHIQAAPIQNITALRTEVAPLWVDDPSGRGTWSLLSSCTITLGICVWNSIHLNLPSQGERSWVRWARKIKWLFIAILVPEAVVYNAFQQWMVASDFLKKLKKAAQTHNSKEENGAVDGGFDMIYAHFVTMGGFALRVDHLHNALARVTITPQGMLFLASRGHFVQTDIDVINDKSKANLLAKGLAALQILWLLGQVIERKVAKLPVTLLEVHTLVHVFCALVMYLLWLSKPLDVTEPFIIAAEDFQEEVAYMLLATSKKIGDGFDAVDGTPSNHKNKFSWYGNLDPSSTVETIQAGENPGLDPFPVNPSDQEIVTHFKKQTRDADGETHDYMIGSIWERYVPRGESDIFCTMVSGQSLPSGLGPNFPRHAHHLGFQVSLSRKDVKRLDLAGSFIAKAIPNNLPHHSIIPGTEAITSEFSKSVPTDPINLYSVCDEEPRLLCNRKSNWSEQDNNIFSERLDSVSDLFGLLFFIVIVIVQAAYAGAHLSALSIIFPSQKEWLLWKISCYILFAVTALSTIALFLLSISVAFLEDSFSNIQVFVDDLSAWILLTLVPVFLCARAYIVIESFISLRHVPVGVYQTPQGNIMDYVPHL